jgi:hypothetical protein
MATKPKKLLTAVILMTLFASIVYTSIPNAKAAELTSQQKVISTLSNVVGLDTSKYDVTAIQSPNDLYRDNLPRENIRTILDTAGSKLDTLCTFINGSLQKIYVCANEGSPRMNTLSTSDVDMAQDFLTNYQAQSSKSFYGELDSMLTNIDATKNSSTTIGNKRLNVTALEEDTTFRWTYVANGIEAPDKCVVLRYSDGFLNYFIDDWNLYKVGSTKINLSEKDAINIAMSRAKNYSPDSSENGTIGGIKFNVTNAMVFETFLAPAIYAGADKARSQDLLELYPMYNIWVSLDKFYPGYVYGFNVYIWADTKEVYYIHQRISTIDPPAELMASATDSIEPSSNQNANSATSSTYSNMLPTATITLLACATILLVMLPIYFGKKKKTFSLMHLPKTRCLKAAGMLLCLLIFSPLLIAMAAPPVAAANYYRGASVWGSESTGSYNQSLGYSWRKSGSEVTKQRDTAAYIDGLFNGNGYNSLNNQGSHNYTSEKEAILTKVRYLEEDYSQYAVVDFDHGVGVPLDNVFHYMFEDNIGTKLGGTFPGTSAIGNAVYDYVLHGNTTGKAFFAFINTCMSADYNNAYGAFDGSDNYSSTTQGLLPDGTARGMAFAWTHRIVSANPTSNQMSSNGYASPDYGNNCYIGFDFGSAALDQTIENSDYQYYYWVYHFFYFALSFDYTIHTALDLASQDTFYYSPNFDSSPLFNTNGFTSIWRQYINEDWQDSWEGFPFIMSHCHMKVYGNANLKLYQPSVTLSARDENNDPLSPDFKIDNCLLGTGSVRVTPGDHDFYVYSMAGYDFNNITFDYGSSSHTEYTQTVDDQPITSDCVVTAYFTYVEPSHDLTILAINQYSQPGIVPLYIDDHYVGTTGDTYTVTEGEHEIYVLSPINHGGGSYSVFVAYYYDEDYDYDNPMTLSVTEGKTIYACYWTY